MQLTRATSLRLLCAHRRLATPKPLSRLIQGGFTLTHAFTRAGLVTSNTTAMISGDSTNERTNTPANPIARDRHKYPTMAHKLMYMSIRLGFASTLASSKNDDHRGINEKAGINPAFLTTADYLLEPVFSW